MNVNTKSMLLSCLCHNGAVIVDVAENSVETRRGGV